MRAWSKRVISSLLILVILVLLGIMIGTRLSYGTMAVVLSASMEPALPQGALAVTMKVDPDKVKVGDIIAFRSEENPDITTSHRVVEILTDNGEILFRTKGDANEEADLQLVPSKMVSGKVVFNFPRAGNTLLTVINSIYNYVGLTLCIAIPSLVIIGSTIRDLKHNRTLRQKRLEVLAKRQRNWKVRIR